LINAPSARAADCGYGAAADSDGVAAISWLARVSNELK
jgi:hypothetical protein